MQLFGEYLENCVLGRKGHRYEVTDNREATQALKRFFELMQPGTVVVSCDEPERVVIQFTVKP